MTVENYKFDEVETKIHEASLMYKGINRHYGDPNPFRKKVEDYGSDAPAFLSLRKVASLCHHPKNKVNEKIMCFE